MTQILRGVVLSLALAGASMAATITFSGTGVSGSGDFSSIGSGTTFSGSVTIESATDDLTLDEPNNIGSYYLIIGGIQLDISGLGQFQFTPGSLSDVQLVTTNQDEGTDQVEVTYFVGLEPQLVLTFFGDNSGNFVTVPAGANGVDALNQINWAHFLSGNGTILANVPVFQTNTVAAAEFPVGEASFTIDSASNVPEPGTMLVVAAGAVAILIKKRSL